MERIRGKHSSCMDNAALAASVMGYRDVLIDIGTGDGRFVRHFAAQHPEWLAIGIDACRENLRVVSRETPVNVLYIIANALSLPRQLDGLATRITINFPWGSLLAGLVAGDPALLDGLVALARPGAMLDIRLNQGALAEAGATLEAGVTQIRTALCGRHFTIAASAALDADALRACPTTWAKRLAVGRDPSGWNLTARFPCDVR